MSKTSKNLGRFVCGKYVVTCASWGGEDGTSYEIGLRDTSLQPDERDHFCLIQSDFFRPFNLKHYGALAAAMLNHGHPPRTVYHIFSDADELEASHE